MMPAYENMSEYEEGKRDAESGTKRRENPHNRKTDKERFAAWDYGWCAFKFVEEAVDVDRDMVIADGDGRGAFNCEFDFEEALKWVRDMKAAWGDAKISEALKRGTGEVSAASEGDDDAEQSAKAHEKSRYPRVITEGEYAELREAVTENTDWILGIQTAMKEEIRPAVTTANDRIESTQFRLNKMETEFAKNIGEQLDALRTRMDAVEEKATKPAPAAGGEIEVVQVLRQIITTPHDTIVFHRDQCKQLLAIIDAKISEALKRGTEEEKAVEATCPWCSIGIEGEGPCVHVHKTCWVDVLTCAGRGDNPKPAPAAGGEAKENPDTAELTRALWWSISILRGSDFYKIPNHIGEAIALIESLTAKLEAKEESVGNLVKCQHEYERTIAEQAKRIAKLEKQFRSSTERCDWLQKLLNTARMEGDKKDATIATLQAESKRDAATIKRLNALTEPGAEWIKAAVAKVTSRMVGHQLTLMRFVNGDITEALSAAKAEGGAK